MLDLFVRGGPLMWPILLCSVVATTIALERAFFWWRAGRVRERGLLREILASAEVGDFEKAAELGARSRDPVGQMLAEGLAQRDHGLSESLQMAAQGEVERSRRGMSVLDTIVTVAPLLGILGTVSGVIEAFDSLGGQSIQDPGAVRAVTEGIGKALITTAAGLIVAIPTLLVYNALVSALRRMSVRFEHAATALEVAQRKGANLHAPR